MNLIFPLDIIILFRAILNRLFAASILFDQTVSYMAERVVGQGSFGIVFQVIFLIHFMIYSICNSHRRGEGIEFSIIFLGREKKKVIIHAT